MKVTIGHLHTVDWLVDNIYYTTRSKPESDVILLKMDSGDAWFAEASVNRTFFKFLMDTGASKSVMSSKHFLSIPEMFRPQLCNTRMTFQVANREVLSSMGVAHVSIQMYGYTFKLPILFATWETLVAFLGWMLERRQVSLHMHKWAEFGSMQMNMMNPNNCLGVVTMLYAMTK